MADFQTIGLPTIPSPAKKPQVIPQNKVVNSWEQEKPLSTTSNGAQSGTENLAMNQWLSKKPEIKFAPQVSYEASQVVMEDPQKRNEQIETLKQSLKAAYGIAETPKPVEQPRVEAQPVKVEQKIEGGAEIGTLLVGEGGKIGEVRQEREEKTAKVELSTPHTSDIPDSSAEPTPVKPELKPKGNLDFGFFFAKSGEFGGKLAEPLVKGGKIAWKETKAFVGSFISLLKENVFFKVKKKAETPEQKAAEAKQAKDNQYKSRFFDQLRSMARNIFNPDRKRAQKAKVESLNKQIGNKNVSYEGVVNQVTGEVLAHILMDAEKSNSKKSEEEIRRDKQAQLQVATKGKKGPGISMSADKSHNFNNAAKLAG